MENKFFFSIVIPTYNNLENLKKTLETVIKQSFKSFEVIIIDDASSDGTHNFFNKEKFPFELKYIRLDKRSYGPSKPRNLGIDNSVSDWICFLDSDDQWMHNKLEVMYQECTSEPLMDVLCHDEILVNGLKKKKLIHGPYEKDFYWKLLEHGNRLSTSAVTIKRKFILKKKIYFNENKKFISVEDYDFWLQCAFNKAKFKFIKRILGKYIIHNSNISNNFLWHKKQYLNLCLHHIYKAQKYGKNHIKLWKKIYNKYLFDLAFYFLLNKKNIKFFLGILNKLGFKFILIFFNKTFKL